MKTSNKTSYFTRVEDRYVFRVSTAFWHLLIGIITITAIIGIVLLAWSIIPPGKEKVKASAYPTKTSYPPVEKVTLADLNMGDEKVVQPPSIQQAPPPVYHAQPEVENDPGKPAYDLSLSELKRIIPKDEWQPGFWSYPYGELAWQMHPSDPNYRHWNPSGDNVEQRLERSYRPIKARKYSEKKTALDSYLKILKQVPSIKSTEVLNFIIYNMNDRFSDLHILDSAFTLIAKSLKPFSASSDAAQHLIGFVLNNPKATFDFVPFAIHSCNQISDSARFQFLAGLIDGFYTYFNSNVEVQKEATEQFNKLLPQLPGINPAKALRKFYSVYNQKNQKRNAEIGRIDDEYNTQVAAILADSTMRAMQAEENFLADKEKKSELKSKSLYVVAGGFIAIALLGTILTLLSIQRILRKMELLAESKNQ
ncbi:MAG: hypothetical protein WCK92_15430 [Bacteroidota bacterium]